MSLFCIALITFYQRFISPVKGFSCAHNALHQQGSCSQSIKQLITQYGVVRAWPMIRARFSACRYAYVYLKTNPNPFKGDLPCDIGIGECPNLGGSGDCSPCDVLGSCDLPFDWKALSKRTRKRIVIVLLFSLLVLSYVFYGRGIEAIYVIDKGEQSQGLLARLTQRNQPSVRLLLTVDGQKHYSNIVVIEKQNVEYKLILDRTFLNADFDSLQVLDARLNVASELIVVGQLLEAFDSPMMIGKGQRFDYRIKRRWHFK